MPKAKQELEKKESSLAIADAEMFEADANDIRDNISQEDIAIPRISLLQSNSPQANRAHAKHIDGAAPGDFVNSVTKEVISGEKGMLVIPCHFDSTYLEWYPRNSPLGEGFVADHGNNPEVLIGTNKDDKNKDVTDHGTIIEKTAQYYVLIISEDGTTTPAVISMKSTGLKVSRDWNFSIKSIARFNPANGNRLAKAPMFFGAYRLSSNPESKDDYSWFNWAVKPEGDTPLLPNGMELYAEAKAFAMAAANNEKKVDNDVESF